MQETLLLNLIMKIIRTGRKWKIEGNGNGWIFNRTFPRKFKAEIALKVYQEGGNITQYWKKCSDFKAKQSPKIPLHAIENVKKFLKEIRELNPTCDEIQEYGENAGYGVVTITNSERYFGPRLHDTWGTKSGGRVHIDIGCRGCHLMLDQGVAKDFIEFIKEKRGLNKK